MADEPAEKVSDYTFPLFKQERPEDKPNVVILFTDQQRHDTIGALGYDHMMTPNLDRLVREGCAFTHGCTPNPVCVPARHNLLTGLYSRHTGMPVNNSAVIPREIPRLPRILADNGYHCESVGKMHFRPARNHHGLHRMQLMQELFRNPADDDFAMYLRRQGLGHIRNIHGIRNLLYRQPQRSLLPEEHHGTSWVGDRAAEMIRQNRNRPFFLWAGWIAPHPPFAVPDNLADLYKGADLPSPTPLEENPHPKLERSRHGDDYTDPEKTRRVRELYMAAVTHVDKNIGKILAALEEIGQLDNTLIIMTSDHGEMLGDDGSWGKSLPKDPAVRVPLILRWPERVPRGAVRHDHADLMDVMPTILDACGVRYPADYDLPGESLLIPEGCGTRDRSVHYAENASGRSRWISLRGQRYKFNFWFDEGREELYDLQEDPNELRNLMQGELSAGQRAAYKRMKGTLASYEERYGHPGGVEDGEPVPSEEPEGEPWLPGRQPGLNWQFHMHPFNLPPEEAARYQSEKEEVLQATAGEPTLDLSKLSLDYYLSAGGDPDLVEEVRKSADEE